MSRIPRDPDKLRAWRQRSKPLKSGAGLQRGPGPKRKTPIRARNPERSERQFRRAFHSREFVAWVHRMRCAVPGCRRRNIECAHVVTRARFGTWRDVVPLCVEHHREQEARTEWFGAKHGINLYEIAALIARSWAAKLKAEGRRDG